MIRKTDTKQVVGLFRPQKPLGNHMTKRVRQPDERFGSAGVQSLRKVKSDFTRKKKLKKKNRFPFHSAQRTMLGRHELMQHTGMLH